MTRSGPARYLTALIVMSSLALFASCSDDAAATEELREAATVTKTLPSFKATFEATGTAMDGVTRSVLVNVSYSAPDRLHWGSDQPVPLPDDRIETVELVIIGDSEWTRSEDGWSYRFRGSGNLPEPFESLNVLQSAVDVSRDGSGPDAADEHTTRYTLVLPDSRASDVERLERLATTVPDGEALRPLIESLRDVTTRYEVVVGNDSKRIYSIQITASGPDLPQPQTLAITFEYGTPVAIEAPVVSR